MRNNGISRMMSEQDLKILFRRLIKRWEIHNGRETRAKDLLGFVDEFFKKDIEGE